MTDQPGMPPDPFVKRPSDDTPPAPPPPPPPPGYPSAGYGQPPSGYGQLPGGYPQAGSPPPGYGQPYAPPPPTSNSAVVALVCAIASWAVCPMVLAVVAIVFAGKAEQEITSSGGMVQGKGMAQAARIVAWINIGLYALIVVAVVLIILVAAVSSA